MNIQSKDATAFEERVPYAGCPLCGATDVSFDRTTDCSRHPSWAPPLSPQITWMRCSACGHGFTDGYYSDAALAVVFQQVQTNQRPGEQIAKNRDLSAQIVERVLPFKDHGRWLDVGFGNGSLMFTAQEFGFEVHGLDLREEAVEEMQRLGFPARCADICDASDLGPFDVISMADVLEHTPDPKKVLAAAHDLITEDGALFLSMPNADAVLWRTMTDQNTNPYWGEMEHYHNFGRARLYALLQETGFTPRRYGISKRYKCGMEIVAQKAG